MVPDDDPVINNITQRLLNIRHRRRFRLRFSLLALMLATALIPIAIWLVYLTVDDLREPIGSFVKELWNFRKSGDVPLAYIIWPPVVFGSLVLGVAVFLITRSLDAREAMYCGFSMLMIALCVVLVAILLMATGERYGLCAASAAKSGDFFVLIGIPLGVFVAVGALLGWRLAELQ